MEDKIKTKSLLEIKKFLIDHSLMNPINEICGFVGFDSNSNEYVATIEKNQAEDSKSFFAISPASYLRFKKEYSLVCVFHSHVLGDESASEFDIKMSEASCLAFSIYSLNTEKFNIYEPQNKDYDVNILERFKVKFK